MRKNQNKDKTLAGLLDDWGIDNLNDQSFCINVGHTEMVVSRRYLSCDAWRHLFSRKVLSYGVEAGIFGNIIKIYLDGDSI